MEAFLNHLGAHSSNANRIPMQLWVNNTHKEAEENEFYYKFEVIMAKNAKGKTYNKFTFEVEEW